MSRLESASALNSTEQLLVEYDRLAKSLMWEIKNLTTKLAKGEPEGWEGSARRGVHLPSELEQLQKRLASALYIP